MNAIIRCYKPGEHVYGIHFFVLNKGQNSGKPSTEAFANCYVVEVESIEEFDRYYALCYAIWITDKFKPLLVGSVIDFIRIHEFKQLLESAECFTHSNAQKFTQDVMQHVLLEKQLDKLTNLVQKQKQLRRHLLRTFLPA